MTNFESLKMEIKAYTAKNPVPVNISVGLQSLYLDVKDKVCVCVYFFIVKRFH